MGTTGAMGMSEAVNDGLVGLRPALHWHLTSNHFPPLPVAMVDVAVEAIDAAHDEDWERLIALPPGITTGNGSPTVTAARAVESMHLDAFILNEEDDWS